MPITIGYRLARMWAVCTLVCLAALLVQGAADASYSFVVLGDNRPGGHRVETTNVFRQILKEVAALNPAFVIDTGDVVDGTADVSLYTRQVAAVNQAVKAAGVKFYAAAGNHDIRSPETSALFEKEFNPSYFSFNHEGSHFIILSTQIAGESGQITGPQLKWLENDLQGHRTASHTFVFYHQPLWPVGGHINTSLDAHPAERDALARLFRKYRVSAAFAGHEHLFHYTQQEGVKEYITGGAGAGLYRTRDEGTGGFYHYLWVTVSGDGVEVRVVRPGRGFLGTDTPRGSWLTPEAANAVKG